MAHFPDLHPYSYGFQAQPGVLHVGWLDAVHPFEHGTVDPQTLAKLKRLAAAPKELKRGFHVCELCPEFVAAAKGSEQAGKDGAHAGFVAWLRERSSNGEIRVSSEGLTYAAPVLIIHYIEEHGYLPPARFLQAVASADV